MADDELFRVVTFGGYDKTDVEQGILKLKENARAERAQVLDKLKEVEKQISDRDRQIAELKNTLADREQELQDLNQTIRDKYQSYIDNYDTIGSLVYEAKLRAKQINREVDAEKEKMLASARVEAERIRKAAEAEAKKRLQETQEEIDRRNVEGQIQYETAQEELSQVLDTFRQVQKQVMTSYKTIQIIASGRNNTEFSSDNGLEELGD